MWSSAQRPGIANYALSILLMGVREPKGSGKSIFECPLTATTSPVTLMRKTSAGTHWDIRQGFAHKTASWAEFGTLSVP